MALEERWGGELTDAKVYQGMNRGCKICSFVGGKCFYQMSFCSSAFHNANAHVLLYKATAR
jgi:hypothetical protein